MEDGLNFLQTFNPIESKPELLEKTLAGRRELVDRLEELVIDSATSGNKHQRLIIGPRGSGKTHLLRVLYNRISSRPELEGKLRIAYLCEDEYGIAGFLDLIIRIFRSFIRWDRENAAYLSDEMDKLKKVPANDQEKVAISILMRHIEDRTLIIIVENIENIFVGIQKEGQAKLRDFIQQHPVVSLIASNQALFNDVRREDKPFHNFFKITHLKRLTLEEAILFLKSIAKWEKREGLLDFLDKPEGRGRVKAVYDITSGNHRLLVTFYNFVKTDYKKDLAVSFIKTINNLIPYYQSFMNLLSAQQQKVVQYLCQTRIPCNVKDIAENTFTSPGSISKQMSSLVKLRYVDPQPSGKETFYELAEPLLRICFEVKENRGGPVKLFIDFLGNLYSAEEIKQKYMYFHVLSKVSPGKALTEIENALNVIQTTGSTDIIIKAFEENLTTLFIHGSIETITNYLSESLPIIGKHNYLEQYHACFPQVVFNLLARHEDIETDRFEMVETVLKESFKETPALIVPLKFLNIGIRHLKKKEKNALLKFTKEERAIFHKFVLEKIEK